METYGTVIPLLDRELQDRAGVDLRTYDALLHTFESGEAGIRMSDLARKVVLTKAGLTSLVDRLERRGLVQRVPDPDDRRVVRITLTRPGEEVFREAAEVHVAGIDEHVATRLTDEEATVIADALERVQGHHHPEA